MTVWRTSDCVWPGIAARQAGPEPSGPTANPWIDSNGWLLRLAKVAPPGKIVWLMFAPPGRPARRVARILLARHRRYRRLGRQVGGLSGRRPARRPGARRYEGARILEGDCRGRRVLRAAPRVERFEPLGVVGVISDFAGPNESNGQEVLNLLGPPQPGLPHPRIVRGRDRLAGRFPGVDLVDEGAPAPPLRRRLLAFANQGGLLVVGAGWNRPEGNPIGMDHPRMDVRRLGKGRLAVSKASPPDPFMIARDVHMLLGRTYDVARFFNLSAFLSHCTASADRTQELVQIVSFAIRFPGDAGHRVGSREVRIGATVESGLDEPLANRNGARKRRHQSSPAARAGVRRHRTFRQTRISYW